MKKFAVLFVLFILPIVAYLFFASGINSFNKLPILTERVTDFGNWSDLDNNKMSLQGKITVLGFGGSDLMANRGNLFNLNLKIYQRYSEFKDLQFVILCPVGAEKDAEYIATQFAAISDLSHWHFVFAPPAEIESFYNGLKLRDKLSDKLDTPNVYIIDKERNLRGRKDESEYKEGYSTFHPSELSNEMLDDFKIILYEYRAALKKNHNASKRLTN